MQLCMCVRLPHFYDETSFEQYVSSDEINEYQYYCKEKPTIPPIPYPSCRLPKKQDASSCTSIMESESGES
jgi:hypothetical protein